MKKILSLLLITVSSIGAFAQKQVQNPDFENWTLFKPNYNFYAPDDWSDGSACASFNGPEGCQFYIQRTTKAQSGTYALQHFNLNPTGSHVNYSTFGNFQDGFTTPAFTGRPTSVTFYYKYTTDDKQSMDVTFLLYTGSLTGTYESIGAATKNISTSVNSYQKVTVNFAYLTATTPTNILITSDYTDTPATALDTLTLDNFVFNYSNVPTDVTNPTSPDYFTVAVSNKVLSTSKSIDNAAIVDLAGKEAASFNQEGTVFNVEQLKTGIYILTGMVNDTPFSRKVIIE